MARIEQPSPETTARACLPRHRGSFFFAPMTPDLSDFLAMPIRRQGGVAEIIFEHDEQSRPVRLIGFTAPASDSDLEIAEAGLRYYRLLVEALHA